MRKFSKIFSIFSIPILIANVYFYYIANQFYYQPYLPKATYKKFDKFLLADSHGSVLTDYTKVYGIFNFSQPSDNYEDLYRKLLFLIQHTQVHAILLTADDHTLSPYREVSNNNERSMGLLTPQEMIAQYSLATFINYLTNHYIILLNSSTRDFVHLYITHFFFPSESKSKEFILSNWIENTNKTQFVTNRVNMQFNYSQSSAEMRKALIKILLLCRKNNIAVTAIKFPLTDSYSRAIGRKSFGADSVMAHYGVPVLDYKNIFTARDSLFENSDHLNPRGGKFFIDHFLSKALVP